MTIQPPRPWMQEPEAPDVPKLSLHAQALRRRAMKTVPERAANRTPEQWEDDAKYYLETGATENFEYGAEDAERLVRAEQSEATNGLRSNHMRNILTLQSEEMKELGLPEEMSNWITIQSADKLGYSFGKQVPRDIELDESELKVAKAFMSEWEDNRLESMIKSPTMVISMIEKDRTTAAIIEAYKLGGRPAIEQIISLAEAAGDTYMVEGASAYLNRMEMSATARNWMVASGRSEGDEENIGSRYSMFLGAREFAEQQKGDPGAAWKQLRAHAGMAYRSIKKTAPEYDPEFLVGNDYLRLSEVIEGKGSTESGAKILGEWLREEVTDSLLRGSISQQEAEVGAKLFAAKPKAARLLAGKHLGMIMALEQRFEQLDVDVTEEELNGYLESALSSDRTNGTWVGGALSWTVGAAMNILGSIPRGAAGFVNEGKTYAPTAWVFADGTVTNNVAVAGLEIAKRSAKGATMEQDPKLFRAQREHALDIGAPRNLITQLTGPAGDVSFALYENVKDAWDGMMESPAPAKGYALPTVVLDKTHDTGWGRMEALRAAFDPSADYVYDAVMDIARINNEKVGLADQAYAAVADLGLDPSWFIGGPVARQSTRQISRLMPKLASEAEKFLPPRVPGPAKPHPRVPGTPPLVPNGKPMGHQVYDALTGIDTTFAKGFSGERLLDGTLMSEEMVAAHRLLAARAGGGFGGEELARVILTKVVEDPSALQRGLKKAMTEDGMFDQLHRRLVLAGDATFQRRAMQLRSEAEIMVGREAGERAFTAAQRAGLAGAEADRLAQEAAMAAVKDPVKRAEIVRQSGRKAAREFLDHAAPDMEALVRAIPQVKRYQLPKLGTGAVEPKALEWSEYVNKKLHESGRGLHLRLGKEGAYIPISKPVRRLAEAGHKILTSSAEAARMGAALTGAEKAFSLAAKGVKAPFAYAAGYLTFTHIRLPMPDKNGVYATVRVPRRMTRAYRREVAQQMAWVSERVTPMVAMELARPIGRPLTQRERRIVSHMVEARKAYNPHAKMANSGSINAMHGHMAENWTRTNHKGKIEELIPGGQPTAKEVAELAPVADAVEAMIDEVLDEAAEFGMLTEARDRYLPHYVSGGGQAKKLASGRMVEGASPTARMLEGSEQLTRESRMTLAQRWAKGDIIEDDIFTILSRRMMHHHEQLSQLNFMSRVAEELGVPILRGERLVAELVEDIGGVAKVDQQLPWQIADEKRRYGRDLASANKLAGDAQGFRRRLMRIGKSSGTNMREMADGRFLGKALQSDGFMAMAARRSRTVLDKVLPSTARGELRNIARWYRNLERKEKTLRARAARKGLKLREVEGDLMDRIDALEESLVHREILDEQLIKTEHLVTREKKWKESLEAEAKHLAKERRALEMLLRKAEKKIADAGGQAKGVGAAKGAAARPSAAHANRGGNIDEWAAGADKAAAHKARQTKGDIRRLEVARRELVRLDERISKIASKEVTAPAKLRHLNKQKAKLTAEIKGLGTKVENLRVSNAGREELSAKAAKLKDDAKAAAYRRELDDKVAAHRAEVARLRAESRDLTEELGKVRKKEAEYSRLIKEADKELAGLKGGVKADRSAAGAAKTAARRAARRKAAGVERVDALDRDLGELIQMKQAYENWRKQLLEAPVMVDVAEGFRQASREALRAENTLKRELGAMADRYSIDAFDKREYLRRQNLTRAGKTPEGIAKALNKTPGGVIWGAAHAVEYMKVTEQLAEAGISGELLGHLLWEQFKVTSIFQVPLQDLRLLASPKGAMVRVSGPDLTAALSQAVPPGSRAAIPVGSNVAAANAEDALKKAGIVPVGEESAQRLDSARKQLEELDALAAGGDQDAMMRAARVTDATRAKLDEATVLAFDAPPELGASYKYAVDSNVSKADLRDLYVEIAHGKTPIGKELSNWIVPLDLAVAARALLGERVGAHAAAEYLALGGWQRFAVHAGNLFKMSRTVASMTPAYGRRNQIDNYKAIVQVLGFEILSPTFRRVYDGLLEGTLKQVHTPYGPVKLEEIQDAWNLLAGSSKAQLDIPSPGMSAAGRRSKQSQNAYEHALSSAELGARSGGVAGGSPLTKEAARQVRGKHYGAAKKGAVFGAVVGGLMGGSRLAISGALSGATYAHTVKMARGVGPRSALAGARPTLAQQLMPIGEATEVIERGFRQKALLLEILRGRSIDDAVHRTGQLWRDWTNYTLEERYLFGHTLPVLFYNFTKQNTIAQVHRFLVNPAYLGAEARMMSMLSDATPEEWRPEWMNPATSMLRGGKAYTLSSEAFAPLELLAGLTSSPTGMLNPGIQTAGEALFRGLAGQKDRSVKLKKSTALALYKQGTAKHIPGVSFKIGENGVIEGTLDLSNPAMAILYVVAAATGVEAVAKYHGTLTDMWMEDAYFDLGVRAMVGGQVTKLRGDTEEWLVNGNKQQGRKFAKMLDQLTWSEEANGLVRRLSYEMGEEEWDVWRTIIETDATVRSKIGDDLHKWIKELNGQSPGSSELPGGVNSKGVLLGSPR
jgi:hypothetical protein